jgi:dGTPase
VVPDETVHEIAVLKGIAAHYVMRAPERTAAMERQRTLLAELFEALVASEGEALDPTFRADLAAASDDAGRTRVFVDQVASLTDASAVAWHARLTGRVPA